jgi:hypothetical protein
MAWHLSNRRPRVDQPRRKTIPIPRTDPGLSRAVERVSLACKALSAAGNDLAVALSRDGLPVMGIANELEAERERLAEMAEELGELAWKLTMVPAGSLPHTVAA